ncbi:MAG: hypothetical protein J6A89_06580 [Clostridia bacterium]|nr:hypothetical protein [Clostridia bacterium]
MNKEGTFLCTINILKRTLISTKIGTNICALKMKKNSFFVSASNEFVHTKFCIMGKIPTPYLKIKK